MLIEWGGFSATLQRKRVKNINLRIHASGQVSVSAPLRMPMYLIHHFLNQHQAWIHKQQQRLQTHQKPQAAEFETGQYVYFLGQAYQLDLQQDPKNPRVEQDKQTLKIFLSKKSRLGLGPTAQNPDQTPNLNPTTPNPEAQKRLKTWYHEQMLAYLPELRKKWEAIIGVQAKTYLIKTMKSRWGSCHPLKQQITLNLRLIEKPLICLEYVLVHELVHLLEPSHNKRFHALMTHYLPEWKLIKKRLSLAS